MNCQYIFMKKNSIKLNKVYNIIYYISRMNFKISNRASVELKS
jgi:hypothetical protein